MLFGFNVFYVEWNCCWQSISRNFGTTNRLERSSAIAVLPPISTFNWGSIFVAVVSFLVGAGLTARLVRLLYKDKEESFFGVFVDILFTFFLNLMILIASIFLR